MLFKSKQIKTTTVWTRIRAIKCMHYVQIDPTTYPTVMGKQQKLNSTKLWYSYISAGKIQSKKTKQNACVSVVSGFGPRAIA